MGGAKGVELLVMRLLVGAATVALYSTYSQNSAEPVLVMEALIADLHTSNDSLEYCHCTLSLDRSFITVVLSVICTLQP